MLLTIIALSNITIIALSNNNYCIKIVRLFVNKLQMYKVVLRLHVGVHT